LTIKVKGVVDGMDYSIIVELADETRVLGVMVMTGWVIRVWCINTRRATTVFSGINHRFFGRS